MARVATVGLQMLGSYKYHNIRKLAANRATLPGGPNIKLAGLNMAGVLSDWPAEIPFTERAISALSQVKWAEKLLRRLEQAGGVIEQNIPLLFETRFAFEIHAAGSSAEYEYATGLDATTVDFRVMSDAEWFIELVSVRESKATIDASFDDGTFFGLALVGTPGEDSKASEAGEMLLVQQKIGEKVYAGKEVKFPTPVAGRFHMIVADMRGYLGGIPVVDHNDYRQIASGSYRVPDEYVQLWGDEPIKGLFEVANPLRSASFVRDRVHFLAFTREKLYSEGELPSIIKFFANPHLFTGVEEARAALSSFPVRQSKAAG